MRWLKNILGMTEGGEDKAKASQDLMATYSGLLKPCERVAIRLEKLIRSRNAQDKSPVVYEGSGVPPLRESREHEGTNPRTGKATVRTFILCTAYTPADIEFAKGLAKRETDPELRRARGPCQYLLRGDRPEGFEKVLAENPDGTRGEFYLCKFRTPLESRIGAKVRGYGK